MRRRSVRGAPRRASTTSCSSAAAWTARSSRRASSRPSRSSMAAKQSLAFALEPRAHAAFDDYVIDCAWSADGQALAVAGGEGKVALGRVGADSLALDVIGEHLLGTIALAWQP